ncbi:MAG: Rrf2 family transcriptional regulator [Verrucomicrobia bacterium]|nr:Rrf2 family transcriptional regulator [Verrucomicrobiota bacterium]
MNLTKKGEYGLRAMIKMGIAHELGRELLSISELAENDHLPLKFVEQIMLKLRADGFVETKRGKFGGYFLAKPMKDIRMGDLVRCIDGKLAPISCASQSAYEPCSCPDETHCGLRMLMIDVRNAISNILDRYTLADVVEVTLRKMRRNNAPLPFAPPEKKHSSKNIRNPADPADGFLSMFKELK